MDSFLDKLFHRLRYGKIKKQIPKNAVVCDIGCGREARFLKNILSSIKYGIGIDRELEEKEEKKYELRKTELSDKINLKDGVCDTVTLMAVLEHLVKPQEILQESCRILKEGGKIILTTPTPLSKSVLEFLAFKLKIIDQDEIKDHKNYFWPQEVKEMLLKSGFKEENIKAEFFEFFLNGFITAVK